MASSFIDVGFHRWKNKGGTSELSCSCGSWKRHWEKGARKHWPLLCSCSDCSNIATVGGHVVNAFDGRSDVYIVPLCDNCNHRTDSFTLKNGTPVVPANKQETCNIW